MQCLAIMSSSVTCVEYHTDHHLLGLPFATVFFRITRFKDRFSDIVFGLCTFLALFAAICGVARFQFCFTETQTKDAQPRCKGVRSLLLPS